LEGEIFEREEEQSGRDETRERWGEARRHAAERIVVPRDGRNTLRREQRENLGSAIVVGMERGLFTFSNDRLASSRRGCDLLLVGESLPM
jgi:hypothetical protein